MIELHRVVQVENLCIGKTSADKDLTFNQKFLRLSGPVEELVGVGVFVGSGAIWSELVTCKISELKKLPPRFPKHILVHTYICNI